MIDKLIMEVRAKGVSDLHISFGESPIVRDKGMLVRLYEYESFTDEQISDIVKQMLKNSHITESPNDTDIDFCYVTPDNCRQRVNIYRQRGNKALAIRLLNSKVPTIAELHLPEIFAQIAQIPRGLILVTGPTGSGKTTTLAAMINDVNEKRHDHILTLEDPIEYMHTSKQCMVNQRELGEDVATFAGALRSALREDPDVILVGEMRDLETISAAITAAETGHMVMSTLHTIGAAKTIDRIIDVFPPFQQQQIKVQLATVLKAVITQTLIPRADGTGRVPAFEIMMVNDAVANLIREGKTYQIASILQTNVKSGMISLDMYLGALAKAGTITMEAAQDRCVSKDDLKNYVSRG